MRFVVGSETGAAGIVGIQTGPGEIAVTQTRLTEHVHHLIEVVQLRGVIAVLTSKA